jgi:fused signal recognition particle receptor
LRLLSETNTGEATEFNTKRNQAYVLMVVGVNGVGKTTTIGKLAYQFKKAGTMLYLVQQIPFEPQQLINYKFGLIE